ncbi:MAG TPA: hypothetical protein VJ464_30565 [Blastocatellia bacterium]|nr:hypothetical protein [Blastocatellia bacterium]
MNTLAQDGSPTLLEHLRALDPEDEGLGRCLSAHCVGENSTIYRFHRNELSTAEVIHRVVSAVLGDYWFWAFPLRFIPEDRAFTVPEALSGDPINFVVLNDSEKVHSAGVEKARASQSQWRYEFLHRDYAKLLEWCVLVDGNREFADETMVLDIKYKNYNKQYKFLWLLDMEKAEISLRDYCRRQGLKLSQDVSYLGVRFPAGPADRQQYQVVFFANYEGDELQSVISFRLFKETARISDYDVNSIRRYIIDLVSVLLPVWQSIPGRRKSEAEVKEMMRSIYDRYLTEDHELFNHLSAAALFYQQFPEDEDARRLERRCQEHRARLYQRITGEVSTLDPKPDGIYTKEQIEREIRSIAEEQYYVSKKSGPFESCFNIYIKLESIALSQDEFSALQTVWTEMLCNAFKHSPRVIPADNMITLKLELAEGFLIMYVSNPVTARKRRAGTGRGISSVYNRLSRVFTEGKRTPPAEHKMADGKRNWLWTISVKPGKERM